ncbi:MAG: phosphoribosylformylglycinamidine cyclo-ligase [Candidatus Cloacimonetes bacterium]|nr:phosphoribosylformylglycinamidine cyclo-ligase [Candidatus Cloacimonadota bacterium]
MKIKESGTNIDLGNKCSRIAFSWAKQTFKNRVGKAGDLKKGIDGAFANVIDYNGVRLGITSDGIGTKVELAERTGIYNTLGYDLVAMVVDDLAANGFEAANLSNILDVDYLDAEIVEQLMQGLAAAADFSGISVPGGEIAELGSRIGGWGNGMHFNWCSTATGILPDELAEPIAGQDVMPGDKVISLAGRGFRSNGFSLLRKVLSARFGENWHEEKYEDECTWGEKLLTPCLIYSPLITSLIKSRKQIKGIVHVTGGGIADNLNRVLKLTGTGAILDNLQAPHDFMKKVQEMGDISEEQAYLIWNMGNGMLLIADNAEAEELCRLIRELGYKCCIAGEITQEQKIVIHSLGNQPRILNYNTKDVQGK